MSYEPKTWSCDDTITAEDLNHIEQGIANAGGGTASEPLVVTLSWDDANSKYVSDRTFAEISSAFNNGRDILTRFVYGDDVYFSYALNSITPDEVSLFNARRQDGFILRDDDTVEKTQL